MKFIYVAKSGTSRHIDLFEFEALDETEAYQKAKSYALYGGDENGTPDQYCPVDEDRVHESVSVYHADNFLSINIVNAIADNHAYHQRIKEKELEEKDRALYLKLKEKYEGTG